MEIQYIFAIEICYGANIHYRKVHKEQLHEKYFIEKKKIPKFLSFVIFEIFVRKFNDVEAMPREPIYPQK
jgi:hypothetical protein